MGLLGDIGKIAGGIAGNMIAPGIGGAVGAALGGELGKILQKPAMEVFDQFAKDPIGSLANPQSLPSMLVDGVLKQMGLPREFRSLVKFTTDPQSAILEALKGGFAKQIKCVNHQGQTPPPNPSQHGLVTNGSDTIDTGRYLISAKEGELKIYDKETNTWVKAFGDPHLHTSDGDKAQFHENLTIDLEDGTKITIQPTPKDAAGVAWLDKVAVTKGTQAVVMTGFSDGKAGVNMGNVLNNAEHVDRQFADGTVLRAGRQVDDLTFASDGKEIVGSDPTQRWGEHQLDGKGGVSRWNPAWDLPKPHQLPFPIRFPLPFHPGLNLDKLRDVLKNFDPAKTTGGLQDGLQKIVDQAQQLLESITGGGKGGGTNVRDMVREDAVRGSQTEQVGEDVAAGKGGDIYSRLFAVLAKLQKQMENKLGQIEKHAASMDAKGDQAGVLDKATLDKLQFELQQIQNIMNQVTTTATNLLKSEHDTRMSVIRNLA